MIDHTETRDAILLPEHLRIRGALDTEVRQRGIFTVPVYKLALTGHVELTPPRLAELGVGPSAVEWRRAHIAVGISDARHLGFPMAYALASVAAIGMVAAYSMVILRSMRRAAVVGAAVGGLYASLYLLLMNEDYALLIRSVGLFAILGAIMYVTRRVGWYAASARALEAPGPPVRRADALQAGTARVDAQRPSATWRRAVVVAAGDRSGLRLPNLGREEPSLERATAGPGLAHRIVDRGDRDLLGRFDLVKRIELRGELNDLRILHAKLTGEAPVFLGEEKDSLAHVVGAGEPVAGFFRDRDRRQGGDARAVGSRAGLCGQRYGTQCQESGAEQRALYEMHQSQGTGK